MNDDKSKGFDFRKILKNGKQDMKQLYCRERTTGERKKKGWFQNYPKKILKCRLSMCGGEGRVGEEKKKSRGKKKKQDYFRLSEKKKKKKNLRL